jgi:hypothetical protein
MLRWLSSNSAGLRGTLGMVKSPGDRAQVDPFDTSYVAE